MRSKGGYFGFDETDPFPSSALGANSFHYGFHLPTSYSGTQKLLEPSGNRIRDHHGTCRCRVSADLLSPLGRQRWNWEAALLWEASWLWLPREGMKTGAWLDSIGEPSAVGEPVDCSVLTGYTYSHRMHGAGRDLQRSSCSNPQQQEGTSPTKSGCSGSH